MAELDQNPRCTNMREHSIIFTFHSKRAKREVFPDKEIFIELKKRNLYIDNLKILYHRLLSTVLTACHPAFSEPVIARILNGCMPWTRNGQKDIDAAMGFQFFYPFNTWQVIRKYVKSKRQMYGRSFISIKFVVHERFFSN